MTVTGGLSATLTQGGKGTARCTVARGLQTGFIAFLVPDGQTTYSLQLAVAAGTSTLPADKPTSLIGLFNTADSTIEWSAGTNLSKGVAGVITLSADLLHGTIDTDMLPEPASPNPSLTPIHLKGSFDCPAP